MRPAYHRSWARHYDTISRLSFEDFYEDFTEFTLQELLQDLTPPARILDVGCGTGRLTLPLALRGFSVTGVDASAPMLAQLQEKADLLECPVETVTARIQDVPAEASFEIVLCLFTVISYLSEEADLDASFQVMATALKDGGQLFLDCPRPELFHPFTVDTPSLTRQMRFEPLGPDRYQFEDSGTLRLGGQEWTFEDRFEVRYWSPEQVQTKLAEQGLEPVETYPEASESYGSDYFRFQKKPLTGSSA